MVHYIDKDTLVAEIKRKIHNIDYEGLSDRNIGQKQSLYHILSFLDTLEVKEVDLEKEISKYIAYNICLPPDKVKKIAKYFFELGTKATQKGE